MGLLESALAQPRAFFAGKELYPKTIEKAAVLCYSLVQNHPFVDGNKRVAHAAMETFLLLNDLEIIATIDEQEELMLQLASGKMGHRSLFSWLQQHTIKRHL
ncbi:MAG: type II toxin-antitoxin system death-on-curing family toxin [Chitinispirillaceae bacterium]